MIESKATYWGLEHHCNGLERVYPTLHWDGEEPDGPTGPRTHLICDACGEMCELDPIRPWDVPNRRLVSILKRIKRQIGLAL